MNDRGAKLLVWAAAGMTSKPTDIESGCCCDFSFLGSCRSPNTAASVSCGHVDTLRRKEQRSIVWSRAEESDRFLFDRMENSREDAVSGASSRSQEDIWKFSIDTAPSDPILSSTEDSSDFATHDFGKRKRGHIKKSRTQMQGSKAARALRRDISSFRSAYIGRKFSLVRNSELLSSHQQSCGSNTSSAWKPKEESTSWFDNPPSSSHLIFGRNISQESAVLKFQSKSFFERRSPMSKEHLMDGMNQEKFAEARQQQNEHVKMRTYSDNDEAVYNRFERPLNPTEYSEYVHDEPHVGILPPLSALALAQLRLEYGRSLQL